MSSLFLQFHRHIFNFFATSSISSLFMQCLQFLHHSCNFFNIFYSIPVLVFKLILHFPVSSIFIHHFFNFITIYFVRRCFNFFPDSSVSWISLLFFQFLFNFQFHHYSFKFFIVSQLFLQCLNYFLHNFFTFSSLPAPSLQFLQFCNRK